MTRWSGIVGRKEIAPSLPFSIFVLETPSWLQETFLQQKKNDETVWLLIFVLRNQQFLIRSSFFKKILTSFNYRYLNTIRGVIPEPIP